MDNQLVVSEELSSFQEVETFLVGGNFSFILEECTKLANVVGIEAVFASLFGGGKPSKDADAIMVTSYDVIRNVTDDDVFLRFGQQGKLSIIHVFSMLMEQKTWHKGHLLIGERSSNLFYLADKGVPEFCLVKGYFDAIGWRLQATTKKNTGFAKIGSRLFFPAVVQA